MKKRIISIFLILVTAVSLNAFASDSYNALTEAGVLGSDFSSYADTDSVTRGSFAEMTVSLIAMEDMTFSSPVTYSDVDSDSKLGKAIITLTQLKYMSGYGDGTFRPEREMKISEAVKIIVQILGYGYRANSEGGYPTGYMYTAKSLGLLSGVNGAYSDIISFDNAMKLIYNSVDIPLCELTGVGDNLSYTINPERTILSVYHGMGKQKGIVTAGETAALTGYFKTGEEQIRIGSDIYSLSSDVAITEYIGLTVEYIYKTNKEREENIIVSIVPDANNQIVEIDIGDYVGLSGNSVVYEYNEQTKNQGFSQNADVVYNGQNGSLNDSELKAAESGTIRFVSTKRNSVYDLVVIKSYKNMIAGRIDEVTKLVYDEADPSISVSLDDFAKNVKVFDETGAAANFQFISKGDVLTYMDNTEYCEVYVSSKTANGIITETGSENGRAYLVIGGKTVWLTKTASAAFSASANENVRVYLNYFGKGAKVKTLSREGYEFVYLINAKGKVNGPEETVYVKLFDMEEGVLQTTLKANTVIDGVLVKDVTEASFLAAMGGNIERLIGIKTSEEGEVSHIMTAKTIAELEATGNDGFVQTHPLAQRRYGDDPPYLSRAMMLKTNTPIIQIPADVSAADDEDFRMVTPDVFGDGVTVNVEAYNTTVDYAIPEFIVYRPASGAALVPALKYESPLVVIKDKTKVITEDGAPATKVTVQNGSDEEFFYYDGSAVTDAPEADLTYGIDELEKGDVIRYSTDSKEYIRILDVLYDYSSDKWFYTESFTTTGYLYTTVSKIVDTYLYVPYWWDGGVDTYGVFDLTEKTLGIGGVTIIQSRDGRLPVVSGGTTGDVAAHDKAIIHIAYGQFIGIIILR